MALHRLRKVLAFAALGLVCGCGSVSQPDLGQSARRSLDQADQAIGDWLIRARTRSDLDTETAVAVGYLERLRLGLGSPFRLIEYALNDPRLADSTRRRLGWALLSRTLNRQAYQIDPAALDRIGLRAAGPVPGSGRLHLDLIDGVIRQSADPRGGELAVRLAYTIAGAGGRLGRNAPEIAARAAALLRDRELARLDAARLVRAAADAGQDPLALLPRWRAERRFEVELPATTPIATDAELHAIQLTPRLARMIGLLADNAGRRNVLAGRAGLPASLLPAATANRLAAIADSMDAPPETPIAVATILHKDELLAPPWVQGDEREAREAFVENAISGERFAAHYAMLRSRSAWDTGPAATALDAAVAMRSFAQEPVWFPGFGGPSARELQKRWGLAAVTFSDDVPGRWRPYYRRALDLALTDLARVLPALDLHGLRVLFSSVRQRDQSLAMHDPRRRQLVLPPVTSAGTLAHEIAHDLDWQIALRRYRVRGDYASDRAIRVARDRYAEKVQDLTGASMTVTTPTERLSHANRPAEVFARNLDWFVAASLAARGRTNGYLSSVQDDMLTGYGSVRPPDISGAAGTALVAILDEVAPLYPDTRDWFVRHYGLTRALTPYDLMRKVLDGNDVTISTAARGLTDFAAFHEAIDAFDAIEAARDAGLAAIDQWICRAPGASFHREFETARRRLVLTAAQARARGLAVQLARQVGGRAGEAWVAARLDDESPDEEPLDQPTRDVLETIVARARAAGTADLPMPAAFRLDIIAPPAHCAAPLGLRR